MKKRKTHDLSDEEHNSGTDRYLITYADLITLLLGLFVILYAASQVDQEKYSEFSAAMAQYFKTGAGVLEGGDGLLEGQKNGLPEPIFQSGSKVSVDEIVEETKKALSSYIDNGTISMTRGNGNFVLTLPEKLLFKSAKAEIEPAGRFILDTLARVLSGIDKQIAVDGHTDTDPIRTFRYESNWHLSVARATNVAYTLIRSGVPERNMSIRGFGSQRPIAENNDAAGKSKNRRVEVTISEIPGNVPSTRGYADENDSLKRNDSTG